MGRPHRKSIGSRKQNPRVQYLILGALDGMSFLTPARGMGLLNPAKLPVTLDSNPGQMIGKHLQPLLNHNRIITSSPQIGGDQPRWGRDVRCD